MKPGFRQEHGGNRRHAQAEFGLEDVVDFSASINPLGQPEGLREHLFAQWEEVLHYPDVGAGELRQALGRAYGLRADRVLAGNGSAELFDLALRALAPRRVVLSPPDFGLYARLLPLGTQVREVPRLEASAFAPDLGSLAAAAAPGDLVLLSNPSNPAGGAVGAREMRNLLERCAGAGAWLAVDEAFSDFCPEASILADAGAAERLLVFRSLTKFYGIPGLRLGFVAGPAEALESLSRLQVPWSVNALAQEAGIYCLARAGWPERTRAAVETGRRHLAEGLSALPGFRPLPSSANYLLVELSPPAPPASALYDRLARRGLLVRHCGSFGLGERYVRIAVRTPEENALLLAALGEQT